MESISVLTAQLQFIEDPLSIVHIPTNNVEEYLSAIIQLLLHTEGPDVPNEEISRRNEPLSVFNRHGFFAISMTPLECTIVVARHLAERYLLPAIKRRDGDARGIIAGDSYTCVAVTGEGESGQRVLELTTPLALSGIPIFYFSTYFEDMIVFPEAARQSVTTALESRGFIFLEHSHTYVNAHSRTASHSSAVIEPLTPLPRTEAELQAKTIALLKQKGIQPTVDTSLHLLQLAGRSDPLTSNDLLIHLIKCLASAPKFLSVILTQSDSPSILISKEDLEQSFGDAAHELLLGAKDAYLSGLLLDLKDLPSEITGIVCGVVSQLLPTAQMVSVHALDIRYLSCLRSAVLCVPEDDLQSAISLLAEGGLRVRVV